MTFQNKEKRFYQQVGEECAKTYQRLDANESKRFWSKILERRDQNRDAEWINNREKELEILEEVPQMENTPRVTLGNIPKATKLKNLMVYMDSGFKIPSTIDWLSKWIDTDKKQIYKNGGPKERSPKTEPPPYNY